MLGTNSYQSFEILKVISKNVRMVYGHHISYDHLNLFLFIGTYYHLDQISSRST